MALSEYVESERRWGRGILFETNKNDNDLFEHLSQKNRKVFYILGKGFDIRMNFGIQKILDRSSIKQLDCFLIGFNEGSSSPSHKLKSHVDENFDDLKKMISKVGNIKTHNISMWDGRGHNKRRVSSNRAMEIFSDAEDFGDYTDIVIDISSLPRSIFFPLIGKILYLLDNCEKNKKNLFIMVTENAKLDNLIIEEGIDEHSSVVKGFHGQLELNSDNEIPVIWLPVLGEGKLAQLERVYRDINPEEICPILPFPSKNPRRSDDILVEYQKFLFDSLKVEKQNIIYAHEQNPFSIYKQIIKSYDYYSQSLESLGGCKIALSALSSKLLSLGTLLASYDLSERQKKPVGVVNIESHGYEIPDKNLYNTLSNNNELYTLWIIGEPYEY
jgi:hypothetical protein